MHKAIIFLPHGASRGGRENNCAYLIREQNCERIFGNNTSVNRFVMSETILRRLKLIDVCYGEESTLYEYNNDGVFISNPALKLKNKKDV